MKKWILLLLLFAIAQFACAQNYIPEVKKFTTEDGLSSNEVYSIHKDARGFMWIGTLYGLNRFDGQEFKTYTKENTPDLNFNIVNDILEDGKGNLWLIKSQEKYQHIFNTMEINLFNIYSGKIQTLEEYFGTDLPFKVADITFVKQLSDSSIFIRCNKIQKTFRYSSQEGFQQIPFPTEFIQVADVLLLDDRYLVSGQIKSNHRLFEVGITGEILNKNYSGRAWEIRDDQQSYPLETWGYYNLKLFEHTMPDWKTLNWEKDGTKTSIYQTEFNKTLGLFWLREYRRISAVDPEGQIVFSIPTHTEGFEKIPFFFDDKTTWFSDKKEGLVAVTLEPNHFQTLQFLENPIDNSMRGIMKDQNGTLWFDAMKGFGKMDAEEQVSIINTKDGFSNFLKDSEGNIWRHNHEVFVKYDLENDQEVSFQLPLRNYVWSMFEAENDEIWISGGYYNFIALNPETGKYTNKGNFPVDERSIFDIYHFQKRNNETVWICSSQGLFIVNLEGEILATFNDQQTGEFYFPAKDFHHIYQKGNELWIATGNAGLFQISNHTDSIGKLTIEKQYTSTTGLSSNSLHAVYADDFDYLWISSDHGLMQLDRRDGQIFKYFKTNGIQHDEFNRIAHYQANDGTLYLGGLYGITYFKPMHFSDRRAEAEPPQLEISDFHQFSGKEEVFKNLTGSLLQNNQIVLQPEDRFFKLKLGLLDFDHGENSIYHYRIKGLYDWQKTPNSELSISGLPYGKHSLEVKAQNGNRQYSANTLSFDIQVMRPFYMRWWFIALALGLLGLGVFIFFKRRTHSLLLQQEAYQLKSLDQMKSRFFANISHELRTPLTLIGLPLKHLMKNYDQLSKKEVMQYLKAVHKNKENINQLVNEILDLSKLEAGKLKLNDQVMALRPFLERVIGVFNSAAMTKNIQYRFSSFVSETVVVKMDDAKLEMVINNLLSNALKFTPGNGTIAISTEWDEEKGLQFKVQDTGRGIHKDDLPHVFERYFQSTQNNTKLEGGSGIGLAICKEFVELMGGSIRVHSEPGAGATFLVNLPLERTTLEPDTSAVTSVQEESFLEVGQQIAQPIFSKEKQTILIAEDHIELRQHIQNILTPHYNILTASNGQEALNMLDASGQIPNLILSDVMMPEMDGFTFLEKVKQSKDWCHLPFILLTARADIKDKLQALTLGVDDYLTKPFEVDELLLRIKNLLGNVKNRTIEMPIVETKSPKAPEENKATNFTPRDLEWIKEVETIAYREIKNNRFNFGDLASELHISKRQMARRVKQITGFTPIQYFREIKLQKARALLENQEVSTLKEVTYAIGFENTFYFGKLFYERFGRRAESFFQHTT